MDERETGRDSKRYKYTGEDAVKWDPLPPAEPEELSKAEMRLIGRATKSRWPIPDETRVLLTARLATLAKTTQSQRQFTRAAKTLLAMDALNQKDEHAGLLEDDVSVAAAAKFRAAREEADRERKRGERD